MQRRGQSSVRAGFW
uniref:Uncharacterized protein n=1 Tax=Arundo donax TaxID=35708 RepID=A0A0A8XQ21_ARUDO